MRALRIALLAAVACGTNGSGSLPPLGQILLHVDTDATLPSPPGETLGPEDPRPLFDRVRIEVFRPGEQAPCSDCIHEFDVDRALVLAGRASVGITPPVGTPGYVARVRLYKASFVELGQPRADATIDRWIALPPIDAEGITDVTVPMLVDHVATTDGSLAAPSQPELGPPDGTRAGSWPGARRETCANSPRYDEVCVNGGAYWMGNPLMRQVHGLNDLPVLRIVMLSPFIIDAHEVTVASFRKSNLARARDPMDAHDGDNRGLEAPLRCTWTPNAENFEDLPVTCLSWQRARAYCLSRGMDLPTEAQLEYVAGGFDGKLHPWGDDAPSCEDAVFARSVFTLLPEDKCPGAWLMPPGNGTRDRLVLETGTIVDLAGNVAEYALDRWNRQDEACWGTGVAFDPICASPSRDPATADSHTVKGGSWVYPATNTSSAFRAPTPPFADAQKEGPSGGPRYMYEVTATGFRCARKAE